MSGIERYRSFVGLLVAASHVARITVLIPAPFCCVGFSFWNPGNVGLVCVRYFGTL